MNKDAMKQTNENIANHRKKENEQEKEKNQKNKEEEKEPKNKNNNFLNFNYLEGDAEWRKYLAQFCSEGQWLEKFFARDNLTDIQMRQYITVFGSNLRERHADRPRETYDEFRNAKINGRWR